VEKREGERGNFGVEELDNPKIGAFKNKERRMERGERELF
jgi:hypothetical protein